MSKKLSWSELLLQLEEEFSGSDVDVDRVRDVMLSYDSCPEDWKEFARFDHNRYTRNLVNECTNKYNLILLCWGEGQGSSVHDHSDAHCFMKVLSGQLRETLYSWPAEGDSGPLRKDKETVFPSNQVAYISDSIGLHRVENSSHADKAVSLHLYCPAFGSCQTFDERTGKRNTCRVVFHSKGGHVCQPV